MFYLYTSNRLEHLITALAQIVSDFPLDPLEKEIIVVQSKGMERWITMQLAEHLGIWANGYFPFLDKILWDLFKTLIGQLSDTSKFEREIMTWSLMEKLPHFLAMPAFAELRHYLQEDQNELKRFQLAQRLANTFDQYIIFRPQMIIEWEKGDVSGGWQAILWRDLTKNHGFQHRASLRQLFLKTLLNTNNHVKLPKRLSVFGIPAFPPFYLDILTKLGEIIDIYIFLLNPCCEYWADISPTRISGRKESLAKTEESLHFEEGNSLLASLGKLGSDFVKLLEDYNPQKKEFFESPPETSLLTCIQADILNLRTRGRDEFPKKIIDTADNSIQIHICHSPMREVEVLHDQLLALFEKDSTLFPKDILVMMPNVEKYAPFVQAVFATTSDRTRQIPFNITDRSLRYESALINTFLAILELPKGRFTVNAVLTILETDAVQRRFDLSTNELELIRYWVEQTRIRWGLNSADRQQRNLPAFEENTWETGLRRLLLGYALPSHEEHLFHDILPYDAIEGSDTLTLGKLTEFIETLSRYRQALAQSRPLTEWRGFLLESLGKFFLPTIFQETQVQKIRVILNKLASDSQIINFDMPINYEVILYYLRQNLEGEPLPANFLTGQVSFCAMLPMRSIPFKVICLLGMNDQDYPRADQPLGFDLIAQQPQLGDRSRRHSDRYLFLEALISARTCFYISYIGRSIRDDAVLPPSVLVSELEDYLRTGFTHPNQPKILDALTVYHPLQPFSPRYFGCDPKLFSYSKEYCSASTKMLWPAQKPPLFLQELLPMPAEHWRTVHVEQLTRFFRHPTEFLIKNHLGIQFSTETELIETEPFEIKGLERYQLKQTLVEISLAGHDLHAYYPLVKASGRLPHGQVGKTLYNQLITEIAPFLERVRRATARPRLANQRIYLDFKELKLTGWLNQLWANQRVHYRCAELRAKDHIQLWIQHVVLNSLTDQAVPKTSLLIGASEVWRYEPIANSIEILHLLLGNYWQGLQRILPFFPESSMNYIKTLLTTRSETDALQAAEAEWRGNDFSRGEKEDAYHHVCFRGVDSSQLFDAAFKKLALGFFMPLLEHRKLEKL